MRSTACLVSILALMGAAPSAFAQTPPPPVVATAAAPTYTAAQFYDTTSYGMAYSGAKAFSPDGASVLISSDKTGVINAYALPLAGGDPVALTSSTTSAARAVSYSRRTRGSCSHRTAAVTNWTTSSSAPRMGLSPT